MPLFYFNIRTGDVLVEDIEGGEFPELNAAKADAEESIRALAADQLRSHSTVQVQLIHVCDSDRKVVAVVTLPEVLEKALAHAALDQLKKLPGKHELD